MSITAETLGYTQGGEEIRRYRLTNRNGYEASFTNLGAIWTGLVMPDRNGNKADVLLGYDTAEGLMELSGEMGAIVGRNANRIKDAEFKLNGITYRLAKNNGPNNLHSGPDKFSKRIFRAEPKSAGGADKLHFFLHSPEGDQGFPGTLEAEIIYTFTDDNALTIAYKLTAGTQDTVANFTSHPYFNLAGHASGSARGQLIWIDADQFCESDQNTCTTGRLLRVDNTPFDFRTPKALGRDLETDTEQLRFCGGYDHNFCLKHEQGKTALAATAFDEASGRFMEVFTDRPGLQLYSGNFLDPEVTAKEGAHYHRYDGYAFEAQFYPNAINVPEWEQPVVKAGTTQESATTYRFSVREE